MNVNTDGENIELLQYSLLFREEYSLHHSNQRGVNRVRNTFNTSLSLIISFLLPLWKAVLNHFFFNFSLFCFKAQKITRTITTNTTITVCYDKCS